MDRIMARAPGLPAGAFALLFVVTAATAIGNLGLVAVMPAIGRALAIPDFLVACIFSLSALVWAVASPFWARQSDRRGRKPLLLIGMAGFAGSMAGCAGVVIAGLNLAIMPLMIFLAFAVIRASYGLFGAAATTAAQAYVADHVAGQARVRALSALAGALNLGTILGPAVAPLLIMPAPVGLAGPLVGFAAGGLLLLGLVAMILPEGRVACTAGGGPTAPARGGLWQEPTVRPLLVYGMVAASMQAINIYTLGFAIIDTLHADPARAQFAIGLAMSLGAAAGMVAQFGLVGLAGLGPRGMLRWGALLAALGNALVVAEGGVTAILIGFPLASLGYGLARPGFAAAASIAVGPERQGAVAGWVSSIAGASIALPPILAVALYQLWMPAPFLIAAAGMAAMFAYAFATPAIIGSGRGMFPASD